MDCKHTNLDFEPSFVEIDQIFTEIWLFER